MPRRSTILQVEEREVEVSNLDKVFYPSEDFTKGQVLDYYIRIAPHLLPHLHDRAVTLKRYPDGAHGSFFYEKQCPKHAPHWIKTSKVKKTDGIIRYCVFNDLPSLVWAANIANLEWHVFTHHIRAPKRPTSLVFDLDPGPPADILDCAEVAFILKRLFDALELQSFVKTSGSKGLQMMVPLNTPFTYTRTKNFAHILADSLASHYPDRIVSDMKKSIRKGKVLIDWSQNDDHKTTVCVYSLRAKEHPSVSTPITWQELRTAVKRKDPRRLFFHPDEVLRRCEKYGDLFADILHLEQKLPNLADLQSATDSA